MKNIVKQISVKITNQEIQHFYQFVNSPNDYKIDVKSYQLIDKIIELYFNSIGYDFWNNSYPEVVETHINKNNEIEFVYIL
jgi:hypothetical protein